MIFQVPEHPTPWPTAGLRRVSVNSFGASGTNAHVILDDTLNYLRERNLRGNHCTKEDPISVVAPSSNGIEPTQAPQLNGHSASNGTEPPQALHVNGHGASNGVEPTQAPQLNGHSTSNGIEPTHDLQLNGNNASKEWVEQITPPRLIILSAFDKPALQRVLDLHSQWMEENKAAIKANPELLRDMAYTLLERRSLLRYRTFAVVDEEDAVEVGGGRFSAPIRAMKQPRVAFVFTGQGAQWAGMGRELFQFPVFYETIKEADTYLKEIGAGWDLIGKMGTFILTWSFANQHKMCLAITTTIRV